MRTAIWVYPEDLRDEGTHQALATIAAAGIDEVRLAVSYHRAEVITPRSRHRRVLRTTDGLHFVPSANGYGRLRPVLASSEGPRAPELLREIRGAGLRPTAWIVIANNTTLGEQHPEAAVRNAWGDHLPFALCVANPTVREYSVALVRDAATQLDAEELVLEAWHHRRLSNSMARQLSVVPRDSVLARRLAWCFCPACEQHARDAQLDPVELAAQVRTGMVDRTLAAGWSRVREGIVTSFARLLVGAAGERPVRLFVPSVDQASADGIDLATLPVVTPQVSVACYEDTADGVHDAAGRARRLVGPDADLEVALRPGDPGTGPSVRSLVASAVRAGQPASVSFYQYGQMTSGVLAGFDGATESPRT